MSQSTPNEVLQITVAEVEDGAHQNDLVALMRERARFMATQPGFVSIALHRSLDGKKVVNLVRWASRDQLVSAHQSPEFRDRWPDVGRAAEDIEPALYVLAHREG